MLWQSETCYFEYFFWFNPDVDLKALLLQAEHRNRGETLGKRRCNFASEPRPP